jgi:hydroxymethylpyrimidine pyrophosphatase-like HAD family hydrolase
MQRYIFLDLDDTLFQTKRKCEFGADDPRLQVRAYLPDGTANSFATHKQQWLWDWLQQGFKLVAVTARDVGAFQRCTLPFSEEVVLNHGAVILNKQRDIDAVWWQQITSELPAYYEKLLDVWAQVEHYAHAHDGYKLRLVEDFGVHWYGVVKHKSRLETPLQVLLDEVIKPHPFLQDGSLYWHLNGNNLAVLPTILRKENAVRYLLEGYRAQHSDLITFAAGDSKTDAPFLALCDYALIPKNTQLFKALLKAAD